MGQYMYRVHARLLTLSDGRKAHLAAYAYKPWRSWGSDKENARSHFRTGCVASENMTLKSDLIVTIDPEDPTSEGRLYHNTRGLKTFLDDSTFGYPEMPCLGTVRQTGDGKTLELIPK